MAIFSNLMGRKALIGFLALGLSGYALGADRIIKAVFIEPPTGSPEKVFLVAPDQASIEVELPSRNFSPDIVIPKGNLIYAVLPRDLAEGEEIPKGAPTVQIPKDWSRSYLLFTFQKKNKVFPLEVLSIDGSANKFALGESRVVNLSEALVRGKFGGKVVDVRPGRMENLDAPLKKFGAYPVTIDYLMRGDKKPKPLARTNWQHNPDSRQVVLITQPAGVKFPRVRALQDRIPAQQE